MIDEFSYIKVQDVVTNRTADAESQLRKLRNNVADLQGTLDTLLVKAAQTEDALADEFMRLAQQKQQELAMVRQRVDDLQTGKQTQGGDAAKVLELAQHLARQYDTLPAGQKRRVVDSVFLNLSLDGVSVCGDYRLPFSILAENGDHPLNSERQDLNLRPHGPQPCALPN
jgi:TolA-binding protein